MPLSSQGHRQPVTSDRRVAFDPLRAQREWHMKTRTPILQGLLAPRLGCLQRLAKNLIPAQQQPSHATAKPVMTCLGAHLGTMPRVRTPCVAETSHAATCNVINRCGLLQSYCLLQLSVCRLLTACWASVRAPSIHNQRALRLLLTHSCRRAGHPHWQVVRSTPDKQHHSWRCRPPKLPCQRTISSMHCFLYHRINCGGGKFATRTCSSACKQHNWRFVTESRSAHTMIAEPSRCSYASMPL
jgi:hypothetical protein